MERGQHVAFSFWLIIQSQDISKAISQKVQKMVYLEELQ